MEQVDKLGRQKYEQLYLSQGRTYGVRGLRLTVTVDASPDTGLSKQTIEETKAALRELGLKDDIKLGD